MNFLELCFKALLLTFWVSSGLYIWSNAISDTMTLSCKVKSPTVRMLSLQKFFWNLAGIIRIWRGEPLGSWLGHKGPILLDEIGDSIKGVYCLLVSCLLSWDDTARKLLRGASPLILEFQASRTRRKWIFIHYKLLSLQYLWQKNGEYGDKTQILILCVCAFICVYEQVFCRGQRAIWDVSA